MKYNQLSALKADLFRIAGSHSNKSLIKNILFNRTFKPIFTMRMCQYFRSKRDVFSKVILMFFKVLHRISCNKAGVDLSWQTSIGPGFCLTHGWGTVINRDAVIGSNVTVFHGVTIGRKDTILDSGERIIGYPIIHDNVFIGPNSVIVGGINIGQGSIIAPSSMIYKDIEASTCVGGNPQKVLRSNVLEDVMNKAPIERIS